MPIAPLGLRSPPSSRSNRSRAATTSSRLPSHRVSVANSTSSSGKTLSSASNAFLNHAKEEIDVAVFVDHSTRSRKVECLFKGCLGRYETLEGLNFAWGASLQGRPRRCLSRRRLLLLPPVSYYTLSAPRYPLCTLSPPNDSDILGRRHRSRPIVSIRIGDGERASNKDNDVIAISFVTLRHSPSRSLLRAPTVSRPPEPMQYNLVDTLKV